MRESRVSLWVVGALVAGATAVAVGPAPAPVAALTTYVVNSTLDEPWDGTPGVCSSTPSGQCTLRAAFEAHAGVNDDLVVDLTSLPRGSTITTGSLLTIPSFPGRSTELRGSPLPDRRVLIQTASPGFGVLRYDGPLDSPLSITGIAVRGGRAGEGAGLWASGPVTLRNFEASGNVATGDGGGVHVESWSLNIEDSHIFLNEATRGAGIDAEGTTLNVVRTEISDNVASGVGGGIWVSPRVSSQPQISQSSILRNTSGSGTGGAISCETCSSLVNNLRLDDVSIEGTGGDAVSTTGDVVATNLTASVSGGNAINAVNGDLTHTTLTGNGAITGEYVARSSVIDVECSTPITVSGGESVITACATVGDGEVITAPPSLGLFAPIGGVRTGSGGELPVAQLLNPLDSAPCRAPADARGLARPATGCEHGAVEGNAGAPDLALSVTSNGDTHDAITGDGICADAAGTCTLRAAVMEADAFPSTDAITIDTPGPIALQPSPFNDTYSCGEIDLDARCDDLDTNNLTVRAADTAAPVEIRSAGGRIFDVRASTTLEGLDLVGGFPAGDGGVVNADVPSGHMLTIRDSRLRDGEARNGGGLNIDGFGDVTLERVVVSGNTASETNGGGINVEGGVRLIATGLTVRDNSVPVGIGGGLSIGSGMEVSISRSLVQGNDALEGGGLACLCSDVELAETTISGNSADVASAIRYFVGPGTPAEALRLTNVSVLGNMAQIDGGVVVRTGTTGPTSVTLRMRHTTIAGNSTVGGDIAGLLVDPNTGQVVVAASVLAGNTGGADCNGDIVSEGAVFTASFCTVTSGPPVDTRDPELEPIVDAPVPNTGAPFSLTSVPVARPRLTSPAVDSTPCGPPTVALDVLGTARPVGPACDAGSVEVAGIAMRLFPSSSAPTAAGAGRIALADLSPAAVRPKPVGDGPGLLGPTVDDQAVRAVDLRESPLGRIPLGRIPLGRIALGALPLGRIPLSSIPLDIDGGWAALLDDTPLAQVPLQNVTLGEVVALDPPGFADVELGQLDLSSTPLGRIPLGSIAYATVPLGRIPLPDNLQWCEDVILPSLPEPKPTCGPGGDLDPDDEDTTLLALSLQGIPLGRIPLGSIPLGRIDLTDAPLGRIPLGRIDLAASPLGRIPLGRIPLGRIDLGGTPLGRIEMEAIPLGRIPLGRIPLGRIDLTDAPLGRIPLGRIDLTDAPLGRIPLGRIDLTDSPLGRIPLGRIDLTDSPLGRIPLGRIPLGRIDLVVDCQAVDCTTATLAQAAARGALRPDATLADLGEYGGSVLADLQGLSELDGVTLADLGFYGDAVLADLLGAFGDLHLDELGVGGLADLIGWDDFDALLEELTIDQLLDILPPDVLDELTLGELLQGVIDPGDYPWEDVDLNAAADDLAAGGGTVTFVVEIQSQVEGASDYELDIALPTGFRHVPGSLTYDGAIRSTDIAPDRTSVAAVLEPRPDASQVTVEALVPLDVGTAGRAAATLTTTVGGSPITVTATGVDQVVAEAFEVNDSPDDATVLAPETLYLTHLASATDVDWFTVDVEQGARLSVILSNLDVDFDAVLFGPAPQRLRKAPDASVVPAADGGRSLLAQGTVPAVAPVDDIDTTPPPGLAVVAVSANRGQTDERLDTTPLDGGTYYVRITGYQGASSARPYALRASLTAPRFSGACPARPAPTSGSPAATNLPAGMTTLYVLDGARLQANHPASDGTPGGVDVVTALDELITAVNAIPPTGEDPFGDEIAGVVDLAGLGGVRAAYDSWDADPCNPAAANGVVSAVGAAIDNVITDHPTVTHLVLVGNDDQIPFARVRDATVYSNEREYTPEVGDAQSPLTSALALGYLLSDDPYADAHPVSVGTRELFVPALAVGRLVEQPAEIITALDNYVRFNGELDPATALSTGYDFLDDGAHAVADALADNGLSTTTLIGDSWTADDLDAALNQAPDVTSFNAHFDHFRALPADQDRTGSMDDLYTLADVTDDTGAGLEGALLFSMGCHAGLSVSDVTVSGLRQADWAQTLSGQGAVFAGNTGYGYGDDAVVGATEDLMRRFATALDGTLSIGQAMALAKQQYVAGTAVVTPFDEKVVAQVVMYGLPQLRLGDGTPVEPDPNPPLRVDPDTGLDTADVAVTGTVDDEFQLVPTDRGDYYTFEGDASTTPDQPVQPRAIRDLTQDGRELRGVLLTGLQSTDLALPDPVYFTPAVDLGATAPEVSVTPTSFPTALQSVSRYETPTGPRDQAVLIPGQFFGDPASPTGGGTQRLFTSITAEAYYAPTNGAPAADTTAPLISRSVAVLDDDGGLSLRVDVSDESPVQLVTVMYTDSRDPGVWVEVPLPALGGGTYGADVTVAGDVEEIDFFTQAVDAGGNVARSTNKAVYFQSVELGPPAIGLSGPLGPAGWYTGPVSVTVTPFVPGGDVAVTVNGDPVTGPLTLTTDGAYDIVATTPGGPAAREIARVDGAPPTLEVQRSPAVGPTTGPVDVRLLGHDRGIGVESITYSIDGGDEVTVPGASATVVVSTPGVTTISARAHDGLGQHSDPVVTEVEILAAPVDTEPPVVECGELPSDWHATDVVIGCTADDGDGSGLADPDQASFALTTTVPDGTATQDASTNSVVVCDREDNCVTAGPIRSLKVDKADPAIDVRFPLSGGSVLLGDDVLGDVGCTDVGSGVASCTIGAIDTSSIGTKSVTATSTDVAGNTTTVTVPYRVVYLWSGFYLLRESPDVNVSIRGLPIPITFNLFDASGRRVRDIQAITSISYTRRTCGGPNLGAPVVVSTPSQPNGLVDAILLWAFPWITPKQAGCYQLRVQLADGSSHPVEFRLL